MLQLCVQEKRVTVEKLKFFNKLFAWRDGNDKKKCDLFFQLSSALYHILHSCSFRMALLGMDLSAVQGDSE